MLQEFSTAIWARGVCKTYGGKTGKKVLDSFDLTVDKGTIFGLLGASGCGKTTFLGSVVGCKQFDAGEIRVLGYLPGQGLVKSIGYMPQDVALVPEFTVKGAVQHYGWIYGMTSKEIDERFEFLHSLLDLPPKNRLIKNLSGGQQRRVSLAVVLVHNPDILILDEPTVGLDPVLRQNIWDYLVQLAEVEKKTIVITTHYIEEARQAHKIGLMRNGKLLAEDHPETLMQSYGCTNVEEVFLLLSKKQQEPQTAEPSTEAVELSELRDGNKEIIKTDIDKPPLLDNIKTSHRFTTFGHARALVSKNLIKLTRNVSTLMFAFTFPLVELLLFFFAIGFNPRGILGVIDHELEPYKDCATFGLHHTIGVVPYNSTESEFIKCNYTGLSCKFLEHLPEEIADLKFYGSLSDAESAIRTGQITALIEFHKNFTRNQARIRESLSVDDKQLEDLQISVHQIDGDYLFSRFLTKYFADRFQNFSQSLEEDCGLNSRWLELPLRIFDPVYGDKDAPFQTYMLPGFLVLVTVFLGMSVSSLTVITERTDGVWERTQVAGVSKSEIMIFHFFVMSLLNFLQNILIWITAIYIFQRPYAGNGFAAFCLLTLQGLVGVALGTFFSVISRSVSECIIVSLGLFYPFIVLCGVYWPIEAMHPIIKVLSYCIPLTIGVESMQNIMLRGWGIANYHVFKSVYASILWCVGINVINMVILRFEKR